MSCLGGRHLHPLLLGVRDLLGVSKARIQGGRILHVVDQRFSVRGLQLGGREDPRTEGNIIGVDELLGGLLRYGPL